MTDRFVRSRLVRAVCASRALQETEDWARKAKSQLLELAADAPNIFERYRLRVMAEQADKAAYLMTELPRVPGLPALPEETPSE